MQTLSIDRLSRLYHLRPSQLDRQRLLDACLGEAIERHLEFDLAEAGIGDDEEICLRLVEVPLSFNLGQSQSATSQHWSSIICRHIRLELEQGGANVLRYRSRVHALLAFAEDVARGQLQRSWAWNQIGLADLGMDAGLEQARTQLVSALLREPAALCAVFSRLAERRSLVSWLAALCARDRGRLIDGVLAGAAIDRRWLEAAPLPAGTETETAAAPFARYALAGSSIRAHLRANAGNADCRSLPARAWAVLILLELEPLWLRRPERAVKAAIAALEQTLAPVLMSGGERRAGVADESSAAHSAQRGDTTTAAPRGQTAASPGADPAVGADGPDPGRVADPVEGAAGRAARAEHHGEHPGDDGPDSRGPESSAPPQRTDEAARARQDIRSAFGGLFLLLPLLAEVPADGGSSLIERIVADPEFEARPLGWVLHRLSTVWLPIPTGDAALRLFCNVDLEADWPWPVEEPPGTGEQAALARYAAAVESGLRARFGPGEFAGPGGIERLCRREARLLVDGGWLELLFDLQQVDTEIRRAGLDLDPGFVPWLGKVVKIRYE